METLHFLPSKRFSTVTEHERLCTQFRARSHAARIGSARSNQSSLVFNPIQIRKRRKQDTLARCDPQNGTVPQARNDGRTTRPQLSTNPSFGMSMIHGSQKTADRETPRTRPPNCPATSEILPHQHYLERMAIFEALRELASDERSFMQQSTATILASAITAEHRAGDVDAAKCHTNALQHWFELRGGLHTIESLPLETQVELLMVIVAFNISILTTQASFDQALDSFEMPLSHHSIHELGKHTSQITNEGLQLTCLYLLNTFLGRHASPYYHNLKLQHGTEAYELQNGAGTIILALAKALDHISSEAAQALPTLKAIEFVQLLSFASGHTRDAVRKSLAGDLPITKIVRLEQLKAEIRMGRFRAMMGSLRNG